MKVSVTGVLEDGMPRQPGVPVNPRRHLNIPRGTDLQIEVPVITPLGTPVDLGGAGTELLLTVKKTPHDCRPRIVKAATLLGNVGTFTIQPGDTRKLEEGLYGWDVWLTKDGLRDSVVPLSPINLLAANAAVPASPPPEVVNVTVGDTDPFVLQFAPLNITGWTVELIVVMDPTNTIIFATIPVGTDGIANVDTSTLPVGQFPAHVRTTDLTPTIKTSQPAFILNVLSV